MSFGALFIFKLTQAYNLMNQKLKPGLLMKKGNLLLVYPQLFSSLKETNFIYFYCQLPLYCSFYYAAFICVIY